MKKKKKKVKTPPPKQRPLHNVDNLLDEAKYDKLTTEELIYVVEQIKASKPGDNILNGIRKKTLQIINSLKFSRKFC